MGNFKGERSFGKRKNERFRDDPPKRFSRGDSSRFRARDPGFSRGSEFERNDSERSFDKRMHPATCATCHQQCEIPFRPREGKPVYCSNCFRKDSNYGPKQPSPVSGGLDQINAKLDKIMRALDIK